MSQNYASAGDFSEGSFWDTIRSCAASMGRSLAHQALSLYYAMENPAMPLTLKLSVMASLAYLVCPVDAIPDVIPVLGYADDAGVLAATYAALKAYVDEDAEAKARAKAEELFG